jgi:hypothetical protein
MTRLSCLFLALGLLLAGCPRTVEPDVGDPIQYVSFGEPIHRDRPALEPAELDADPISFHGQDVRVAGTVIEVCQMEGCWLALENPPGNPVRVHVPRDDRDDYLWTIPTDLGRLHAIVEGTAYADTLTVEELREYAVEAGRSPEQVQEIAEPTIAAHVVARGMLVEQPRAPAPPADAAENGDAAEPRREQTDPAAGPATD